MWKADLLSYRGEMNFIRAYQGNSLVWERPLKNNVIYYTASDGGSITPYYQDNFEDAIIDSNKYEDKLGVITVDSSVSKKKKKTFTSNSRIESVVIPSSVVYIGGFAFGECSSLVEVIVNSQTPPELYYNSAAGEYTSFIKNAPGRLFKVPSGSVNSYKTATGWSNYADSIVSQ